MSKIRLPDGSKLTTNWKYYNDATIWWYEVIFRFSWSCFVSLVKFSYWSKFYINIITGSGVIAIFFYKGLTRNREIGNTAVWVLPNIWRLARVRDSKFGTDVSNKMLLNAAKCHANRGDKITPYPLPSRLGLNIFSAWSMWDLVVNFKSVKNFDLIMIKFLFFHWKIFANKIRATSYILHLLWI